MNRTDRSRTRAFAQRGVLSVKVISILFVGLLVVGTVPVTHSYPSAKVDFNNIWLAAQEFWDSLAFFKSQQHRQEIALLESVDPVVLDTFSETKDVGLERLKNHPECRSIYISEYLPTFSPHVIEKCEKAIKRLDQKQLFDVYVQQLCLNPGNTFVNRKQLGEIQMRLRKYALTFPQSNIETSSADIDGLYGEKTCEMIANYQIISKFEVINGMADTTLYNDLVTAIPLSEAELASLNWERAAQKVSVVKKQEPIKTQTISKTTFKLPKDPSKRKAFCLRNKHIKQCKYSKRGFDLAKTEINQR